MLTLFNSLCLFALLMTINAADVDQDQQNQNSSDVVNKTIGKLIDLCKLFEGKGQNDWNEDRLSDDEKMFFYGAIWLCDRNKNDSISILGKNSSSNDDTNIESGDDKMRNSLRDVNNIMLRKHDRNIQCQQGCYKLCYVTFNRGRHEFLCFCNCQASSRRSGSGFGSGSQAGGDNQFGRGGNIGGGGMNRQPNMGGYGGRYNQPESYNNNVPTSESDYQ